jgi:TetR/AcrR family transcriptional repressor of nem operon
LRTSALTRATIIAKPAGNKIVDSLYQLIDSSGVDTTREALVRNATETVRRGGSASLNFRDLGHSVGIKSSTVHYYFPTKADLLKEIAGEYRAMFITALDQRTEESKSFKQDMLVLVDIFAGAQGEKLSCLCGMLATEAELLDPKVRAAVNQFFARLQEWVVQRAKAWDTSKPGGLPPARFADLLVSLLEGSLLLSRLDAHKSSLSAAREWVQRVV